MTARTRVTACCGAARMRSPPASLACLRPRTSAAMPLESMNSRPARSTMIPGSRTASAPSAAATATASHWSSCPRNVTTVWPSQLRVLSFVLNTGVPFSLLRQGGVLTWQLTLAVLRQTIRLSMPAQREDEPQAAEHDADERRDQRTGQRARHVTDDQEDGRQHR